MLPSSVVMLLVVMTIVWRREREPGLRCTVLSDRTRANPSLRARDSPHSDQYTWRASGRGGERECAKEESVTVLYIQLSGLSWRDHSPIQMAVFANVRRACS